MSLRRADHMCPASRSWQVVGLGKVGCRRVSEAQVDLSGPVPGQRLVRPVGVELDAERLGFSDQVEGVVDLLAVQPLVFSDWNARSRTPFWPGDLTRVRTC